jgi:hypothetical protein
VVQDAHGQAIVEVIQASTDGTSSRSAGTSVFGGALTVLGVLPEGRQLREGPRPGPAARRGRRCR